MLLQLYYKLRQYYYEELVIRRVNLTYTVKFSPGAIFNELENSLMILKLILKQNKQKL